MEPAPVPPILPEYADAVLQRTKPWSAWATAGLGFILLATLFAVQFICGVGFGLIMALQKRRFQLEEIQTNGFFLAIVTIAAAPAVVGMSWWLAAWRTGGQAKDYLALRACRVKTMLFWCAAILLFCGSGQLLSWLLGRPDSEFMVKVYQTAGVPPLLWFAVIIAAPLSEEFMMRGFFFEGWLRSPLRAAGTILLTSIIWAAIHLQYDLYDMTMIFVGGTVLGLARWKTGSILPCLAMHGLWNFISTVEFYLFPR